VPRLLVVFENPAKKQAYGFPETICNMNTALETTCTDWAWRTSGLHSDPRFHTACAPTPLATPEWVAKNDALRQSLCLSQDIWTSPRVLHALAGNTLLQGSHPTASVYSGHQFGVWAGQLGDGRAISLGEIVTPAGVQDLQLKGAGPTPYSRRGDGRAVLRSSIREFLASEAMHGLDIPTTRALCITGSPTKVYREEAETAAVVTRVAPSFIRFGHFEHFAALDDLDALRDLADHVIEHHMPQFLDLQGETRYAALLQEVVERTANLMAHWQSIGFCHGVMNTDNMSILGLTLDYGPFQFMDVFDPQHICNHSDHQGRYAFARQAQIANWNLYALAQALMPLIQQQDLALSALQRFQVVYPQALDARMRAKLGLSTPLADDRALAQDVLKLLHESRVDYTIFWRRLSHSVLASTHCSLAFEPVRDLFVDREAFEAWLNRYLERLGHNTASRQQTGQRMLQTNPKFVLRNHLGELAIRQAKSGDMRMISDLLNVLHTPFDEHPSFESWAGFAPEWASSLDISCSS
jgi:uncharacterized protein YdiU (UPF0061 family)